MWPYLMRYPGLVVLHDGQLHHARAHALLRRGRKRDYIAEFRDAHPDAPEDLAQFVIGGLQGPVYPCGRSSRPWFARPGRSRSTIRGLLMSFARSFRRRRSRRSGWA